MNQPDIKTITIQGRKIGPGYPPFIVAEISANHNQSLDKARDLIKTAAQCGVDAVKLQTYTADTMTLASQRKGFVITDEKSLWHNESLYTLYEKAHTPWEWHAPLFDLAESLGLIYFSTPFDTTAVDFLEGLDIPCYKIASFENTDIGLIQKVAGTGKPVIMSTGLASRSELDRSVQYLKDFGCKELVLLKCTSQYPAPPSAVNLATIPDMADRYNCLVGLSDHTLGVGVSIASVSHGAVLIEKHFTRNRAEGGPDAPFSMEPDEMALLVKECRTAWHAQGQVTYGPVEDEKKSLQFRRSLYLVTDIIKGDTASKDNIKAIRPGLGLSPLEFEKVLGRRFNDDYERGTPLKWNMLADENHG